MLKTLKDMDLYINTTITKIIKDITGYLAKKRGVVGFVFSVYLYKFDMLQDDRFTIFITKAFELGLIVLHFWLYVYTYRFIFAYFLASLTRFIFNDNGVLFFDLFFFIAFYLMYLSHKDRFIESRKV